MRYGAMPASDAKCDVWADYSKRARLFFGSIYGGWPLVALIAGLFPSIASGPIWAGLLMVWVVAVFSAYIYRRMFRCPRCGHRFLGWGLGWPERCWTCRLPRGG